MKRILNVILLSLLFVFAISAARDGSWKIHPTSNGKIFSIVDTPKRVYMLGNAQDVNARYAECRDPFFYVIYYDKASKSIVCPTMMDQLSENVAVFAQYNPDKQYLMVVYHNFNIDLLYDSGKVVNIPGYMLASVSGDKTVTDITFSAKHNRAYITNKFGYIEINDEKGEIAGSRNFSTALTGVARVDDKLIIATPEGDILSSDVSNPNFNLSDFTRVASHSGIEKLLPLSDNQIGLFFYGKKDNGNPFYDVAVYSVGDNSVKDMGLELTTKQIVPNKDGYLLGSGGKLEQLYRNATHFGINRHESEFYKVTGSWDLSSFWIDGGSIGVYERKGTKVQNGVTWGDTGNVLLPDASSAFRSRAMAHHPKYGMLVVNHAYEPPFTTGNTNDPVALGGWKNGSWSRLGYTYTNPTYAGLHKNPNGLGIDPNDNKYVYFGSLFGGLLRMNLDNPQDVLFMSFDKDPNRNLPGFVEVAEQNRVWSTACKVSAVDFDHNGTMWMAYYHMDKKEQINLWYWTAEDRKKVKDASTFIPFGEITIKGEKAGNWEIVRPLKVSTNRNIIIYTGNNYDPPILLIDHNGTLEDTSDDRIVKMDQFYDQDGGLVDKTTINDIFEDPTTGLVWVSTPTGVFYFSPRQAMENPGSVTVPKVNRNDGSGFADYLLHGVDVMRVINDGAGRKWFATNGAGLICTSSDGRNIIHEYTTANSWLPSDEVLTVAYNPDDSTIMVGTMLGNASLLPAASASSSEDISNVRAYPNPVAPDYYGWVTIDGLVDNAIVKIADASGNVVKELGAAASGVAQWDCTNMNHRRVSTGVYYILASSGPNDTSLAKVAKVLVMQ